MDNSAQIKEPCDHDWKFVDDSFDHEYGVEMIHYYQCQLCGETCECNDMDDGEFDYD